MNRGTQIRDAVIRRIQNGKEMLENGTIEFIIEPAKGKDNHHFRIVVKVNEEVVYDKCTVSGSRKDNVPIVDDIVRNIKKKFRHR